jgi:hypothetical protein
MTVEEAMFARWRAPHVIAALAGVVVAMLGLTGCAPSLAPGTRDCVGFPVEVCQSRVADLEQEGQAHGGVAAYRMVCTAATCSAASGEGTETVVFGDGTGRDGGFGYATAADAPTITDPPLTVAPQCLGVPETWCADLGKSAAADATRDGGSVAAVTVACASTCTETGGKGTTSVTLSDGRVIRSGWEYLGSSGQ